MKLSEIGEKEIVKRLGSFLDIGDDAAYLKFGSDFLILTTDMLYEKTHILPKISREQIGKLIVTVNFSDIAAMGARPIAFLLSYGSPDIEFRDFEIMMHGVDNQCKKYNAKFAGGDTNYMDILTLSGAAIGKTKKPILRSGARIGDIIAVTGDLGSAGLGTEILLKNLPVNVNNPAVKKALEPEPMVNEGLLLGNYATSMTDISDSLSVSLYDIAVSSRVGIAIEIDKIPVTENAIETAKKLNLDMLNYALYSEGDYELLFTISEENFNKIRKKIAITKIGEIVKGSKIVGVKEKKKFEIKKKGYEHFKRFL